MIKARQEHRCLAPVSLRTTTQLGFKPRLVIMDGTGLFAGKTGEVWVTTTLTQTSLTTETVSASYTGA